MSNSPLTSYTRISPNSSTRGGNKIRKITVHHMAGNLTVETCGNVFSTPSRQASSNYGIGTDGRIGLYVPEDRAAWTSSSYANDSQAVTMEVANSSVGGDWPVSDRAWRSLVDLCVDICKRNGIPKLVWTGGPSGTLTCHYMFSSTGCPGPYLKERMQRLANEVNAILDGNNTTATEMEIEVKPITNVGGKVIRMLNEKTGEHFYCFDYEANSLKAPWKKEGIAFEAPKGGTVAIYRLRNNGNGFHMFTASYDEAAHLNANGWVLESVPFFGKESGNPVYRLFNKDTNDHFFTISKKEADDAVSKYGYKSEGVAFYM